MFDLGFVVCCFLLCTFLLLTALGIPEVKYAKASADFCVNSIIALNTYVGRYMTVRKYTQIFFGNVLGTCLNSINPCGNICFATFFSWAPQLLITISTSLQRFVFKAQTVSCIFFVIVFYFCFKIKICIYILLTLCT